MVRLVPMSKAELHGYLETAVADYAQDHVQAGNWGEDEALAASQQSFEKLLPQGIDTLNQHLFTIRNELGDPVGMLWFAVMKQWGQRYAFVYDVRVDQAYRRRGYGTQAFRALEEQVRALGLDKIALHVFAHNHAARVMYKKLGYQTTDVMMSKELDAPGA